MPSIRTPDVPLSVPYVARYIDTPLVIDGCLEKKAWEKANIIRSFTVNKTRETPISQTEAKMLWDDTHLYLCYHAKDKDIWSYYTERDDPTCLEDVLEFFFKTSPELEPYFNFEINALGTVYDAFNPKPYFAGGPRRWGKWDCENLQVAVKIHGTINDPTDVDEAWDLEVAIPFASLPTLQGKAPSHGDIWAFHLARYDYSVYLPDKGVEITTCAPLTGTSFHDGSDSWLRLLFER